MWEFGGQGWVGRYFWFFIQEFFGKDFWSVDEDQFVVIWCVVVIYRVVERVVGELGKFRVFFCYRVSGYEEGRKII